MDPELLIFLHIPHTGGTTYKQILRRQYGAGKIKELTGDITASVKIISDYSAEEKRKIQCLIGHVPFGIHKIFPQRTTYFTFLRDPVDRIISFYHFVLRDTSNPLHRDVVGKMDLKEFVETVSACSEHSNLQTRLIGGVGNVDSPTFRPNHQILDIAKRNLSEHFGFVGLTENFDESLILMKRDRLWKNIYYVRRNVSTDRPDQAQVGEAVLETIRERNLLDFELYEFAKRQFEASLAQCGDITKDLRLLRLQTRIYSGFLNPALRIFDVVRRNRTVHRLWWRTFRRYVVYGGSRNIEK